MKPFGKPFKTYDRALKRARFEQAHQQHLASQYVYVVRARKDGPGYQIFREKVVD